MQPRGADEVSAVRRIGGILLLGLLGLAALPASANPAREYEVKAAFLLNFARLVHWPDTAFTAPDMPIRVVCFARNPFAGALEAILAQETVQGRAFRVETTQRLADVRGAHLVFVPADQAGALDDLERTVEDAPVLLVGESEGFAARGGVINLYTEDGRIRFEINRKAAERRGLRLSSRLLRLARLVAEQR